jgi:hypothetical protein
LIHFRVKSARFVFTDESLRELVANYPDVFRSLVSGVGQGGANVLGVRGDLADSAQQTGEWLGRSVGLPDWWIERVRPYAEGAGRLVAGPTAQEVRQQVEGVTGEFYQPQTPFGQTANNIGQNAVQMLAGAPMANALSKSGFRKWFTDSLLLRGPK